MAVGLPAKTSYVNGDVFSASDINDTNGTLNLVGQTTNFYAGKNKIINGDFGVNQRAFTSTTADNTFTFDRWRTSKGGAGTSTYSAETFTLGSAPVAGYEGKNFTQLVTASQSASSDYSLYIQLIESVRTFAGQTVTLSFWAKAGSGTPKIAGEMVQNFGTGGSPSSDVNTAAGAVTISTSWARYSLTVAIPSISGKTIGTNGNDFLGLYLWFSAGSSFNSRASSIGNQNNTFQIWGVQLEAGSTATAFQTATGTIQGELAACQRYYFRTTFGATNANNSPMLPCVTSSTTAAFGVLQGPVQMRVKPTSIDFSQITVSDFWQFTGTAFSSITIDVTSTFGTGLSGSGASGFGGSARFGWFVNVANQNGYIGLSAEL